MGGAAGERGAVREGGRERMRSVCKKRVSFAFHIFLKVYVSSAKCYSRTGPSTRKNDGVVWLVGGWCMGRTKKHAHKKNKKPKLARQNRRVVCTKCVKIETAIQTGMRVVYVGWWYAKSKNKMGMKRV